MGPILVKYLKISGSDRSECKWFQAVTRLPVIRGFKVFGLVWSHCPPPQTTHYQDKTSDRKQQIHVDSTAGGSESVRRFGEKPPKVFALFPAGSTLLPVRAR